MKCQCIVKKRVCKQAAYKNNSGQKEQCRPCLLGIHNHAMLPPKLVI